MRARTVRLVSFLACLGIAITAFAQFGHPLTGTWSGDWGTNKDKRERLLVQMHYDGKQVTGTINPGANAFPLKTVTRPCSSGTRARSPRIWTAAGMRRSF